jgi:hypothetical protein
MIAAMPSPQPSSLLLPNNNNNEEQEEIAITNTTTTEIPERAFGILVHVIEQLSVDLLYETHATPDHRVRQWLALEVRTESVGWWREGTSSRLTFSLYFYSLFVVFIVLLETIGGSSVHSSWTIGVTTSLGSNRCGHVGKRREKEEENEEGSTHFDRF